MNYFQEYERIKKAKSSIQVGSKWIITQSTTGYGGSNRVGRHVIVRSVSMNVIAYSYDGSTSSLYNHLTYERPTDAFKRTFSPRL
jgi:hypothetical protein